MGSPPTIGEHRFVGEPPKIISKPPDIARIPAAHGVMPESGAVLLHADEGYTDTCGVVCGSLFLTW